MSQQNLGSALGKVRWLLAVLFVLPLSTRAGADSYEVYLNKTLLLKQYVGQSASVRSLHLDKAQAEDKLFIMYSHCGVTGKGRHITIRNEKNEVLKEWNFADASGSDKLMSITVRELMELQSKYPDDNLNLVYASRSLLPEGRMLASLDMAGNDVSGISPEKKSPMLIVAGLSGLLFCSLLVLRKIKHV